MSSDVDRAEKLELQIVALRICLSEVLSLMIQKKVLTKRDAVSHIQGLADRVMPAPVGEVGAEVFEQIASYIMKIPLGED